jgi:hypothetical protein
MGPKILFKNFIAINHDSKIYGEYIKIIDEPGRITVSMI